jgi:hypothetical protein
VRAIGRSTTAWVPEKFRAGNFGSMSESLRGLGFAKATHRFIYSGITSAMGTGDISMTVATEDHSSDGRLS